MRSSKDDAGAERGVRRRSDRALLLPGQLLLRQWLHPRHADIGTDVEEAAVALKQMLGAAQAAKYFISGEINTKMPSMSPCRTESRDRSRYKSDDHRSWTASRSSTRGLAFQCRPSNTEPLLRLNLEGTTAEQMERKARRGVVDHSRLSREAGGSSYRRMACAVYSLRQRGVSIVVMFWLPKPAWRVRFRLPRSNHRD